MNRHDVMVLQQMNGYPSLTITLPTHRTSPDNRQDPIRVKNLVSQASDRLLGEFSKREVEPLLTQVHGPVKTILQASVANAWYKSWNWALSERPENAGLYEASARLHWDSTLDLFRRESQVPALRGILQIALKDEPWFETKRNMEAEAIRIKPQA